MIRPLPKAFFTPRGRRTRCLSTLALLCAWPGLARHGATSTAYAAQYYVANAGSDENDGRSPAKAWRSVARVNGYPFKPGDRVLFRQRLEVRPGFARQPTAGRGPSLPMRHALRQPPEWDEPPPDPRS